MPPRAAALLTLATTTVLTACGGTSDSGGGGSSRADKSAREILAETSTAIAKVGSYHLQGNEIDSKDGRVALAGDVSADGRLQVKLTNKGSTAEFVVVGRTSYLRANAPFWQDQGGAQGGKIAKVLAGKWVKTGGATEFLRGMLPKDLGYCLQRETGTLTNAGTRTVNGQEMVVIAAKGDKPGTAAGELYIPAAGPALPTRLRQTGRQKPGGKPDPRCDDDGGSTSTGSDYRLSDYDKPVRITAPKGALTPEELLKAGAQGQETTS
jgi:hypothetical protein